LQPATRRFRHSKRWRLICPPPQDSPETPIFDDSLPAGPARAFSLSTSDEHLPAHLTPQMKSRFRNPAFPALNSGTLAPVRVCLAASRRFRNRGRLPSQRYYHILGCAYRGTSYARHGILYAAHWMLERRLDHGSPRPAFVGLEGLLARTISNSSSKLLVVYFCSVKSEISRC
jgi:hypothetical protein